MIVSKYSPQSEIIALEIDSIRLETKFRRILSWTYVTKYDMT